jgi:hypothetical protein
VSLEETKLSEPQNEDEINPLSKESNIEEEVKEVMPIFIPDNSCLQV